MQETKVALITGSAKRVGACVAKYLHHHGLRIVIHYRHSKQAAKTLCDHLNADRPNSAICAHADLKDVNDIKTLITTTINAWGRLDVLVNNAATFVSTPLHDLELTTWQEAINSNLTAPFFVALKAASYLRKTKGCIINMVDVRANQPFKHYAPYCISKAGLVMATKSLALEWAPDIRVNGIAPGVVLWPDETTEADKVMHQKIIARTPLKRVGTPDDIAKAVHFLVEGGDYLTGQIIGVDGGRSLSW